MNIHSSGTGGRKVVTQYKRRGLTYQEESVLRLAIQPGHHDNPWSSKTQLRNYMIVAITLGIGIRRDEFLSLRVSDIDFRQNMIDIRRSTRDDAGLYQSRPKSLPRRLPMTAPIAELLETYIISERRKHKAVRKHDFLVVSCRNGSPLSGSAYDDIFTAVRDRVPGIPAGFTGYDCRATWKDRVSAEVAPIVPKMAARKLLGSQLTYSFFCFPGFTKKQVEESLQPPPDPDNPGSPVFGL